MNKKGLIWVLIIILVVVIIFLLASSALEEEISDVNVIEMSGDELVVDLGETDTNTKDVKEFTLDASNFQYSLKEIKVNEGDTVRIMLNNTDGFHDIVIDEFAVSSGRIQSPATTSVEFIANKTGTFEYYCSVGNHRAQGMVGQLIVE